MYLQEITTSPIYPEPSEVMQYFMSRSLEWIAEDLELNPRNYTAWFHIAFPEIQHWAAEHLNSTVDSKRA